MSKREGKGREIGRSVLSKRERGRGHDVEKKHLEEIHEILEVSSYCSKA